MKRAERWATGDMRIWECAAAALAAFFAADAIRATLAPFWHALRMLLGF